MSPRPLILQFQLDFPLRSLVYRLELEAVPIILASRNERGNFNGLIGLGHAVLLCGVWRVAR